MKFILVPTYIALASLGFSANGQTPVSDKDEVAAILQQWQLRQEKTETMHVVANGEEVIMKGRFNDKKKKMGAKKDMPPEDLHFGIRLDWTIDFTNQWVRKEEDTSTYDFTAGLRPFYAVDYFDGATMKTFAPREKNTDANFAPSAVQPDIEVHGKAYKEGFFSPNDYPVFFAHGTIPTIDVSPMPGEMSLDNRKQDFSVEGRVLLDGRPCTILKHEGRNGIGYDLYWVDKERHGAVLEWDGYERKRLGNKLWIKAEMQYQQTASIWLPKAWSLTRGNTGTNVVTTFERVSVSTLDINARYEKRQFQIDVSPGQVVEILPENKTFKVGEDGVYREIARGPAKAVEDHGSKLRWIIVPLLFVLFILISVWIIRKRKRGVV